MAGLKNYLKKPVILSIAAFVCIAVVAAAIILLNQGKKQPVSGDQEKPSETNSGEVKGEAALFEDPEGTYNYCPSVIQTDDKTRYIYYCSNKEPNVVKDYIIMRKGTLENGKWSWGERNIVISPSESGWDEVHTCDPDVAAGKFKYKGEEYNYVMAYLACKTYDNTRNETGIAFAKTPEGPWVKYEGNPIVAYDSQKYGIMWGVGQPSLVSIDKAGKLMLYYTRGDKFSTRGCAREVDFSDMQKPFIGPEIDLPVAGLSEADKSAVIMSNFDIARDPSTGKLLGVRDRHPYGPSLPDIISSELQVFSGDSDTVYNPTKKWTELTDITEDETGWPRNHNAAIVTDAYGNLLDSSKMEVVYTSCELGAHSKTLWTYRIHSHIIDLSKLSN